MNSKRFDVVIAEREMIPVVTLRIFVENGTAADVIRSTGPLERPAILTDNIFYQLTHNNGHNDVQGGGSPLH